MRLFKNYFMALIGTLREKAGTWVVVFVFVAIAAFIIGDIFSGNSSILNWGRNSVGEIAGKEISYDEFLSVVKEREANYYLNFNREPGEREMAGIRQQAWDLLIARNAIQAEYAKVGVQVTSQEVLDMIQGKNVDENIKMAFTDQQTGQFSRERLNEYITQLKQQPEGSEARVRWNFFQRDLQPGRERIKYENLLIKSAYVTKAEAEREYHTQNDVAEVKYLYVPYFSVSDTLAKVTDSDLQDYYNKNKVRFKTEETRDIKYVSIPVLPSASDSAEVKEELARAVQEFKTSAEDSLYAVTHSDDIQGAYAKYTAGTLPAFITTESLVEGNVIGPVLDGETYKVVKVSKIFNDTVASARARHILIKWNDASDASKKEAKDKALGILKDIRGGADFAQKAMEFGTDGTRTRGGDLGWFSKGAMVKEFESAVFNASKTGLLSDVVETQYGYHIIDVTDTKTFRAYKLAVVDRQITPSDATINEAFRKAEDFAADLSSIDAFEARAKELGLTVIDGRNVKAGDTRVGNLSDARPLVQWLFRDASRNKVSQVFDLQDEHVVAVMTGIIEKGTKPLDAVKDEITPAVRNLVKGRIISEKLASLKGNSLEEIAQAYGSDANVYSSSDLHLSNPQLTSVGYDVQVAGLAYSLDNGKRSKAFAADNGVVIIEMQNKTIAPSLQDYTTYKTQLEQNASRSSFNIAEAIKDNAGIVDQRYKFF